MRNVEAGLSLEKLFFSQCWFSGIKDWRRLWISRVDTQKDLLSCTFCDIITARAKEEKVDWLQEHSMYTESWFKPFLAFLEG